MKPLVAIVGRPNVGKSMLFNKLCGQRLSIVEDTPGVTRDRLYARCEWGGRSFDIVDTGGIEPDSDDQILTFMRRQAEIAIQNATVIVFVCDIRTGVTASDQDVAALLLRSRCQARPQRLIALAGRCSCFLLMRSMHTKRFEWHCTSKNALAKIALED